MPVDASALSRWAATIKSRMSTARLAGILGYVLIFTGVRLMQRVDSYSLLPALPTGILADVFPNPQWVAAGTVFVLVGCLLAFFWLPSYDGMYLNQAFTGAPDVPSAAQAPSWGLRDALRRLRRIAVSATLGVLALGLYSYVLVEAPTHTPSIAVLLCLIVSLALFGIAISHVQPRGSGRSRLPLLPLTWRDAAIIVAVMGVYLVANALDAWNWFYAFIGDEWSFYDRAKEIAQGSPIDLLSQYGVYGYHPLADSAYQALIMRILGMNVFGWHMSSTLAVALPVPILYWGAKQMGGVAFAAAASVIYTTNIVLLAYAHIGYNNNDPLLAIIPAAVFLYLGARDDRAGLLFAAGVCAGAGWYVFFTGRLMIGVLVVVLLTEWRGGWRAQARRQALMLGGFALTVLPFAIDNGSDTISQMLSQTNLSHATVGSSAHTLQLQNAVRGVYGLAYATLNDHYVVGAVLDVVAAAAACAGIVLALRDRDRLLSRLLLCWLVLPLAVIAPFFYAPQVPDTRIQIVIPAAALLAAWGLCSICQAVQSAVLGPDRGPLLYVCLAGWLVAAVALNGHQFYVEMPQDQGPTLTALTIGALQRAPDSTDILVGDVSNFNLCQVLDGYQIDLRHALHFSGPQLLPQCPDVMQEPTPARPTVLVVVSTETLPLVAGCRMLLSPLVTAPYGQATILGFQFIVPSTPDLPYRERVARRALQLCPSLPLGP